ncbi:MAG: hypothetical protein MAGBODY4_01703 [Candidatus Marinimicrobia bacterium]|nr:hypothetical protein [Candidatus Neomarinimicrobiota bacterium]
MVIGGQAVLLYGEPRQTRDIDITLGIDFDQSDRITDILQETNFELLIKESEEKEFVRRTRVLPILEPESGIRIDFIFSFTPYERQAIDRAEHIDIDDVQVRFATVEDVIIHKIFSGRPRDIEDARSIRRKNEFDETYVRQWLQTFEQSLQKDFLSIFESILES